MKTIIIDLDLPFKERVNIGMLRRIQKRIHKNPILFQMEEVSTLNHDCETAYCIAGWANQLRDVNIEFDFKEREAQDEDLYPLYVGQATIGLTNDEASRLFWMSKWPQQFKGADTFDEEAAGRAIRRIDHFIATEGRE